MALRPLIHDVWLASIALQGLLAIVLIIRKTWTKLPIFTAYAFFNLAEAGITLAAARNGMWYFYSYWACEGVAVVLGLGVVYEVFQVLFSPHAALQRIAKLVFRVTLMLLLVLGVLVISSQPSVETNNIGSTMLVVGEATRMIELGLLMFLFLFSAAFGLHWREHTFGIALGLGVFAAADMVNLTLRSHLGRGSMDVLNLARGLTFCLSVLLWVAYLFAPERTVSSEEVPKKTQLEQWNQAVMELISR
jgi:hypothetical protein